METKRYNKYLISSLTLLVSAILLGMSLHYLYDSNDALNQFRVSSMQEIRVEGLVDHTNQALTQANLANQWSFVLFGYTSCPDVCPATLYQMVQVNRLLKKQKAADRQARFYFVSVDPARDKEKLADYVSYFDPAFVGVTGDVKSIEKFEKQFGAFHRYDKKNSSGYYTVQHSAEVFLIAPNGKLTARFTPPLDINLLVEQFFELVKQYNQATV